MTVINKNNTPPKKTTLHPLLWVLVLNIGLFWGCADPHQNIKEFDNVSISFLGLFLEQEERWARAVSELDSAMAYYSKDSIRMLVLTFPDQKDFEKLKHSAEYRNYVNTTLFFLDFLALETDSVFAKATEIAFLPETEYTKEKEEQLNAVLSHHDRMMDKLLDSLHIVRNDLIERIY